LTPLAQARITWRISALAEPRVMTSQANQIPGMIEQVEQELLRDAASSINLSRDDVVCEFGAYFGRSSRCIADGLLQNPCLDLPAGRPTLHVYDVFECADRGALKNYVLRDAQRAGVESLLNIVSGRLDFLPLFHHFMGELPPGLMLAHRTTLKSARHPGGSIAMMHIDAPKWLVEYTQVLLEFGPHLKPGALLVFQDFFYHWSSELISAVEIFIQQQRFEPLETAASSLLVRVDGPILRHSVDALKSLAAPGAVDRLVGAAIARFSGFELDRPHAFLPRLHLAGMQHAFESGDHSGAAEWLLRLRKLFKGSLPPTVTSDLADLMSHGFSMRRLYERDTEPTASLDP
jgi:hypothetical protein